MPERVLFGETGFNWLRRNLKRRGFRLIEKYEVKKDIDRLGLTPTRPFRPFTAVFIWDEPSGGYTVKVRTTYNMASQVAEGSGNGWVMILDGDVRVKTDRPYNRTKNFLYRLLERACIARHYVTHRPNCTTCKAAMNIVPGPHLKQVYWDCPNGCGWMSWDDPITDPEVLKRVMRARRERKRTDARTREMGKTPHQKMLKRAKRPPWIVTNSPNLRRSRLVP